MPLKGNSSGKEENKGETRGEGQLEADSKLQLKSKEVVIGLSWDVTDQKSPVDLDASCCLFDNEGNFQSSVYFGVLTNENASVIHTGDNRSGEGDGDDECIVIKLDKVPESCRALVICINSYSGDTFANVNSATARILDASASKGRKQELELGRYELKAAGNHSGLLMCKIYRSSEDPSQWWLHTLGVPANGRSFADLLPLMQARLTDIIPNARIAKAPNVVVLAKGEMVALNSDRGLKTSRLTFGLGWDPIGSEAVDLDASCVMFDEKHSMREAVFFNQLKSSNGAVRHAGDNLTGNGAGDDEQIFVDLDSLPSDVTTLYILVNSYSGHPFSRVKNCFVRVINGYARTKSDTNELVRYDLAGTGNPDHTALILCKVFSPDGARKGQRRWKLQALGYGTKGTMYKDNLTDLTKDLAGRLKIGENLNGFKYAPLQKGGTGSSSAQPASTTDVLKLIIVILVILLFWSIFTSNRGNSGGNSRIR